MEYQDHFLLCANDQYATLSDIVSLTNEGRSTPGVCASRTLKTRFCSVLTCPLNMWIKNYKSTWRKYNQGRSNICCTQVVIFSWTTSSGHYCLSPQRHSFLSPMHYPVLPVMREHLEGAQTVSPAYTWVQRVPKKTFKLVALRKWHDSCVCWLLLLVSCSAFLGSGVLWSCSLH